MLLLVLALHLPRKISLGNGVWRGKRIQFGTLNQGVGLAVLFPG